MHSKLPLLARNGPFHPCALPSAFIRSYLAFKSSTGVGSFGACSAASGHWRFRLTYLLSLV